MVTSIYTAQKQVEKHVSDKKRQQKTSAGYPKANISKSICQANLGENVSVTIKLDITIVIA